MNEGEDQICSENAGKSATEISKTEKKINHLNATISEQRKLLEVLENKLKIVLIPEGLKEGSGGAEDKKAESPIIDMLESKINKMEVANNKLSNIIDRIDL